MKRQISRLLFSSLFAVAAGGFFLAGCQNSSPEAGSTASGRSDSSPTSPTTSAGQADVAASQNIETESAGTNLVQVTLDVPNMT